MKTIRLIVLALCVSASSFSIYAKDNEVSKTIKKEYPYNEGVHLMINNKFGKVDVKDWDNNSISIEVIITVNYPNKEKAEQLLECITVEFTETDKLIQANTVFNNKMDNIYHGSEERNLMIYYNVYVPKQIQLSITNKYGDIFLNQLTGLLDIDLAYGNMKAEKLLRDDDKPMSIIKLAYGSAGISETRWLKIDMKYSKLNIDDSKAIILLSKYSSIKVGSVSSLVTESKYDSYDLGQVSNFVSTCSYSNYKIESVQNKLMLESKYTDLKVGYVPKDFKTIEVDSKYGKVNIKIDPAASYKIDGEADYGKIYCPDEGNVSKNDDSNTFTVTGYVGKKDTESVVRINSSYCSVKLTEE